MLGTAINLARWFDTAVLCVDSCGFLETVCTTLLQVQTFNVTCSMSIVSDDVLAQYKRFHLAGASNLYIKLILHVC